MPPEEAQPSEELAEVGPPPKEVMQMNAVDAVALTQLVIEGFVTIDEYENIRLTEKGTDAVNLVLDRLPPGQVLMLGLHYADKFGIALAQ